MEHYVTLFDSHYLPQGLALHLSLQRYAGNHTLWVVCMDADTFNALKRLSLPDVRPVAMSDYEDDRLLAVKKIRTRGEYCWTVTPFVPGIVFDCDLTVSRVTYVDADLALFKKPGPIFNEFELSGKSVLITEHAFSPEYDQTATAGRYCVQWMTFYRIGSDKVRNWWGERCIEWCYARHENGKFGDQMYLNDWDTRFTTDVHVLKNVHFTQAPWNATRFPYSDAIFYHFHGLKILVDKKLHLSYYKIPKPTIENVYKTYINYLTKVDKILSAIDIKTPVQAKKYFFTRQINVLSKSTSNLLKIIFKNSYKF